jgi:ABC-type multidrug transport system ATPase subunit
LKKKAIHIDLISKKFKETQALDSVSLQINEGELFGLIGPDGAGKTTLIKILVTLLDSDVGQATILGMDTLHSKDAIRQIIGYMPGRFSLYPDLTVEENLSFFARAFDTSLEENYSLIQSIYDQIKPFKDRKAGALSGGMKQKLALCCALIHRPKILILDEPTTGVDAVSRKEFWQMLQEIKSQGITILVSTPYMDEANLCDRIAFIQNGKILSIDMPNNITDQFPWQLFALKSKRKYDLIEWLRKWSKISYCYAFGEYLHVAFSDQNIQTSQINKYLSERAISDAEIKLIPPTIEDTFIYLMENGSSR